MKLVSTKYDVRVKDADGNVREHTFTDREEAIDFANLISNAREVVAVTERTLILSQVHWQLDWEID